MKPGYRLLHDFEVLGVPKAKGRHRHRATAGGKVFTHPDKNTVAAEQDFGLQSLQHRPAKPHTGELGIRIDAFMPVPKSMPKYKRELALARKLRPGKKPDPDNLLKLVCDALQGIYYENDSQFVGKNIEKWYSDRPRWRVRLYEWRYDNGKEKR